MVAGKISCNAKLNISVDVDLRLLQFTSLNQVLSSGCSVSTTSVIEITDINLPFSMTGI